MYILIVNLGLKNTRSIIFDLSGKEIRNFAMPIRTFVNGFNVEQDANEWWRKTKKVISQSIEDRSVREKIKYVTVTSSSSCLVSVDVHFQPLRKVIMVSDRRAVKQANELTGKKEFVDISKNKNFPQNSYSMIPKIMWVRENEPLIFKKIFKFLSPSDFLVARLTGKIVADSLSAEKFCFDSEKKVYPEKLLSSLSIEKNSLPEVVDPGTNIGALRQEIIKDFGLPKDAEMIVTTYDAICAVFGSGVTGDKDACEVSGTVTSVRTIISPSRGNAVVNNDKIFTQSLNKHNISIIGGSNNQGGSLIEWLKQTFYEKKPLSYQMMEKEAGKSIIGVNGLVFLPYLLGERMPLWNPNATGVFFGLQRFHGRSDMSRAVFESTGFMLRTMLDEIESSGVTVRDIKLGGGLTNIPLISQLKADISGKTVLLTKNHEHSAYGAFILTLLCAQIKKNLVNTVKELIKFQKIIHPNQENHQKYSEIYKLYKNLYFALCDSFEERKNLIDKIYPKEEKLKRVENL